MEKLTNQEKWDSIVQKIRDLGDELQEIFETIDRDKDPENVDNIETALMGLSITADDLGDQEIPE